MPVRRKLYEERKKLLEKNMNAEVEKLSAQARFVRMVVDGKLVVANRKKKELLVELSKLGFPLRYASAEEKRRNKAKDEIDNRNEEEEEEEKELVTEEDKESESLTRGYVFF